MKKPIKSSTTNDVKEMASIVVKYGIPDLPRYTPDLNAALDGLVKVFSSMPCPPPESFLYHDEYNQFGEYCPPNAKTLHAFDILSKRVLGASVINAENIFDLRSLMYHCEIDVKVWLMPQMLLAIRNWWSVKLSEDTEKLKEIRHEDEIIRTLFGFRVEAIRAARFLTKSVAYVFCDTFKNENNDEPDHGAATRRRRLEQAKIFKRYMTPDMCRAMKCYLTLWYEVMGLQYDVQPMGKMLGRQWVHNCWL